MNLFDHRVVSPADQTAPMAQDDIGLACEICGALLRYETAQKHVDWHRDEAERVTASQRERAAKGLPR